MDWAKNVERPNALLGHIKSKQFADEQNEKAADLFCKAYGWVRLRYADPLGPRVYKGFKVL